jgi:hypothetical protein
MEANVKKKNIELVRQKKHSKYESLKSRRRSVGLDPMRRDFFGELTSRGESTRGTGSGKEGEDDRCEELHGRVLVVLEENGNCNCDAHEKDTQQDAQTSSTNVRKSIF